MKKKSWGYFTAVFNSDNNMVDLVKDKFVNKFSERSYKKYITPLIYDGVMGIFDEKPNKYSLFFVNEVAKLASKKHKYVLDNTKEL